MTTLSASENVLLRTYPQQSDYYLSIFRPAIAMKAQVNGSYDYDTQTISYDGVTEGSYLNIRDYLFQVAFIGTAPGLSDLGRTWVRSATASTLRFVESSHINWQNDAYITVLKYTEIIPIFPRIIKNPANEEDVIFYKIWDVAYTNQNTILGTFIQASDNYAGFDTQVYWSASGSVNLKGEALSYAWSFEGALTTGSTAMIPGYIQYPGPGHYRTLLSVTSASGRVDTTVRYASIYDRPEVGSSTPIQKWTMTELSSSIDGIGGSARIKVRDTVASSDIMDGALVVIFGDDYYGSTQQHIHNNGMGRSHIKFFGYLDGGTIQWDYADGSVEFEIVSPTKIMEMCTSFSVSVESKGAPSTWYELQNMTVKRAIYHYLAWHSTVLQCCNFIPDFDDRNIQYFDADRTSLYDAINSLMDGALQGRIVSDRLGNLYAFQDISVLDNPTTLPIALDLSAMDWVGEPTITERQYNELSYLEMGGISYDPSSGASSAYLGAAPGLSPAYHGRVDRPQGLALSSQADLNRIVGNKYAFENSRYPQVDLKLRFNANHLDVVPQQQVLLTVAPLDTPRRITWNKKNFVVRGVASTWNSESRVERQTLSLAEITDGFGGSTVVIPIDPPDTDDTGGSYTQPPAVVPPIATPATPAAIAVYDNGVFVLNATALNFLGQIVHVEPNPTTPTMADIMFQACGCSGTFASSISGTVAAEVYFKNESSASVPFQNDVTQDYWMFSRPSGTYTISYDSDGIFAELSGDVTLVLPATGYYDFKFTGLGVGCSPNSSGFDFDWSSTIRIGNYSQSKSGTQVGFITGGMFCPFTDGTYRVFLTAGEHSIRVSTKITDHTSSTVVPDWWGIIGYLRVELIK